MADPNFNSAERMDIYRSMFLLNRSFHLIVQRLDQLKFLFHPRDLRDMLGMTPGSSTGNQYHSARSP